MKKVEEVKKITEEQLTVIKDHQKDLNKSLTNLGFLETQKHSLLHEYAGLVEDIEKYKKDLEDIYGAININIEDGTYTDIEKE
ncbi:MAG: hypothetical protein CMJ25_11830 [Phycisphaerae bacterium]|jgi:hemerythrin|nr:hypothetical protein [Phycisphaerae bacterium]|tara:strand:- start:375 stop:623 length:249 start_codon:yes stop_codon:yes gene_type:complete